MTWHEFLLSDLVLDHTLEGAVLGRLRGRLLDFTVEEKNGSLVLHGIAPSYHVKQLAQCEVMSLTHQPISANNIKVEPRIVTSYR